MDKPTQDKISLLHPLIKEEVNKLINEAQLLLPPNVIIRIVQGLRTIDEQNALYAQGRTTPGSIVTKAKGGSSFHNYGLAIDFCLLVDGKVSWNVDSNWMKVVKVFKDNGYTWGGDWKSITDKPHFEKTFGLTWQALFTKYTVGDFIPGTKYVKI
jgi:peptidoglycan L-alanyl-D-glutamate endopeptidase CwlK